VSSGNGGTTHEHTEYYTTAPSGNLKYARWSERWRMGIQLRNITESDRKRELEVVKNERRQRVEIVPYRAGRHRLWEAVIRSQVPPLGLGELREVKVE
jgi:zinc protease